ncbi:MAG: hypothetical protein WCA44_09715 [Acidobacteriaceae bacterium]
MKAKGTVELPVDQELLAAAVIGIVEEGEGALVLGGVGFERENGGLQRELKAGADVEGLGDLEGGRHLNWRED